MKLCGVMAAIALLAGAAAALSGCGSSVDATGRHDVELRVFAAASLTDAFTTLGDRFTARHPGVSITFVFAGSQDLVTQLDQGAPGDVLATADQESMAKVAELVETPRVFAANALQIVVAPGDPLHIRGLAGLARPGLKVVLAAPQVPAGKYAALALRSAGVSVSPVSLEDSVKGVMTKVSLGEADAGIVYMTDVIAAGDAVSGVAIPASQNLTALYPVARVTSGRHEDAAQAFIDLVLSADGRRILRQAGFVPPRTQ